MCVWRYVMKKMMLVVLVLLLSLTACQSAPVMVQTAPAATSVHSSNVSPSAADTPSPSPSPSPDASASALPSPAPTISLLPAAVSNTVANSNYTLYEDGNYIYFLNTNDEIQADLFRIDKKTGNVTKITDKDCSCFTVCKGIVYYTELSKPHAGHWNVIKSYDPSTNIMKTVKELDYNIYNMAAYGNKLYFSYNPKKTDEPYSDLYVIGLDGTGMERVAKDVYTFCINKDVVYYTESSHDDLAVVDRINFDGSGKKQLVEADDWYFDFGDNKLFYDTGYIDFSTGKSKKMGYNEFALFGHCLIYDDYSVSGKKETCNFHSYDLSSGQRNELTTIKDIDVSSTGNLHAANDCVYYSVVKDSGSFDLYRLVIENGEASINMIATYTNGN